MGSLGDNGLCPLGDTLRLATNTPACNAIEEDLGKLADGKAFEPNMHSNILKVK